MKVIHFLKNPRAPFKLRPGDEARGVCGKAATVVDFDADRARYNLLDGQSGNRFAGTTREQFVTCKKCVSLLSVGTIHARRLTTSSDGN